MERELPQARRGRKNALRTRPPEGPGRSGEAVHRGRAVVAFLLPGFNTGCVPIAYTPPFVERERSDREVIETMQHDARNGAQRVLYALLAGAEGCSPNARPNSEAPIEIPKRRQPR